MRVKFPLRRLDGMSVRSASGGASRTRMRPKPGNIIAQLAGGESIGQFGNLAKIIERVEKRSRTAKRGLLARGETRRQQQPYFEACPQLIVMCGP